MGVTLEGYSFNQNSGVCSISIGFQNMAESAFGIYSFYVYQIINDTTTVQCGVMQVLINKAHEQIAYRNFNCLIPVLGEKKKIRLVQVNPDKTTIILSERDAQSLIDGALLINKHSNSLTVTQGLHLLYDLDISGLKYNIQETVITTLGSAYPYVRRNGSQKYRTFTISGLISFEQGYQKILINTVALQNEYNAITDQRLKERWFREKVINFLQDGKEKFFSTVEEGSMIIRLTNVSLTPKKELGRMIYSFSATATESSEIKENLVLNTQGLAQ